MKQGWGIRPFEKCIEKVKYTTKIATCDYSTMGAYPVVSQEEEYISGYWNNAEDVFKVSKPVVIFGDHTRVLKYVDFDFVLGADGVHSCKFFDFVGGKQHIPHGAGWRKVVYRFSKAYCASFGCRH